MTPADLPRRAVASGKLTWRPGMRVLLRSYSERVEDGRVVGEWSSYAERIDEDGRAPEGYRAHAGRDTDGDVEVIGPDVEDAATVGCLAALVRELHGPRPVYVMIEHRRYFVTISLDSYGWESDETIPYETEGYASEAEALVVALEAAP